MSELVNFVCWSSAEVTATIPTEAATPSDAVLLATHTPLRIRREGDVGQDAIVSESDVLDEFLNGDPNHGVRVATVLGESGAGKSHLIRWVNAKIESRPDRHVIYLPKTETSLKDVIEALLVNQHDPVLDELRNRVSTLGSGLSLDEMEHRILDALAEALRTAEADSAYGKALVGENGLRLFFIDPYSNSICYARDHSLSVEQSTHFMAAMLTSLMSLWSSRSTNCHWTSWITRVLRTPRR